MTESAYKLAFGDWEGIDRLGPDFPGTLLTLHGQYDAADSRKLARAYADNTLRMIRLTLENGDLDYLEWAYPPLFLARHTLELYLKNCYPDYDELLTEKGLKGGRHRIDYLLDHLLDDLDPKLLSGDAQAAFEFLKTFHRIDPKSMAFRFSNGAIESFRDDRKANADFAVPEPEIPVNFRALYNALKGAFEALDRIILLLEQKRSQAFADSLHDLPDIDLSDMDPPND